ncbi:WD40 repeat-like protein [Flagelloscypha sp. PMI_526]|nr:WD40 repeat-like protein [Flagelloscypha sp. PMI_526]
MESETTFVAPEGVYSMTEEIKPAPIVGMPIAGGLNSQGYPAKLSSVTIRYPTNSSGKGQVGLAQFLQVNKDKEKKDIKKDDGSLSGSDQTNPDLLPEDDPNLLPTSPTVPEQPTIFSQVPKTKKHSNSRPKHNIRTTSSTFVSRIQNAEGHAKALAAKQGEVVFLFYNSSKNFIWVESGSKAKDPIAKITFSSFPTCHDVNLSTASSEKIDIVIGFHTGDLVWLDPISSRYARLNKGGCISSAQCTCVLIIFDKEREDGVFTPTTPPESEWDPLDSIFVSMPPWHPSLLGDGLGPSGGAEDEGESKNPVSHWKVSKRKIVDFVFSPDVKHVAAVSEDGCLRVIDALAEQLVDCYSSYFGALTCVAWSPDSRFILTGGQDDLLTLFSPYSQRVVARCQAHSSFVTSVAFDEWKCDGRTYRFGSVGEDGKLILWDFSPGTLHRPKFQATHNQRQSMASTVSLALRRGNASAIYQSSALYLPGSHPGSPGVIGGEIEGVPPTRYHAAPARNEISIVQPVLVKHPIPPTTTTPSSHATNELPTSITFLSRCVVTASKAGHVKFWIRPLVLGGIGTKGTKSSKAGKGSFY